MIPIYIISFAEDIENFEMIDCIYRELIGIAAGIGTNITTMFYLVHDRVLVD